MQVTVFGASGQVGQLVVAELLRRQYKVVVFVHNRSPFAEQAGLHIVKGDVHDPAAVAAAIQNSQAVISTLGSWGTTGKDVLSSAMKYLVPAMGAIHISRLVSLTGAEAETKGEAKTFVHLFMHKLFGVIAGGVLRDGEKHLEILQASQLNWTVLRSPVMTTGGRPTYRLSGKRPLPWQTVSRPAVALAMVNAVEDLTYNRQAPFISRI